MRQSELFQKTKSTEKHDAYQQHFLAKKCVECRISTEEKSPFIFCDFCDDGYHWVCLKPPVTQAQFQGMDQWICHACSDIGKRVEDRSQQVETQCYKCGESLVCEIELIKVQIRNGKQIADTTIGEDQIMKCRHCSHCFHLQCFSQRLCSLNCSECEAELRESGPKYLTEYFEYMEDSLLKVEKMGYLPLRDIDTSEQFQKLENIKLINYNFVLRWEQVCRIYGSLYYALATSRQSYCSSQLYSSEKLMALNQSSLNFERPKVLSEPDQETYQEFRANIGRHYLPPLQVKQDRVKGFYVVAVDYIPERTLLTEYFGQGETRRNDNKKHLENDSIMSLIVTEFTETSLDIVPVHFGNVARFILGIPEGRTDLTNVRCLNFCYGGRSHVIFFSIRGIREGEPLYIDYNDGVFEEYPTAHFTE